MLVIGHAVAAVHIHNGEVGYCLLRIGGGLVTHHGVGLAAFVEVAFYRDEALVGQGLFSRVRVFAVGDIDLGNIIAVVFCCRDRLDRKYC